MLPLFEMLMKANGGDAVNQMARQFGLNAQQVQSAWEALLPAFSMGLKRNAADPYGMGALMQSMVQNGHANYFQNAANAFNPQGIQAGNDILGQLFGSKDMSRAIAAQAAQATGIGQEILKQMLPAMASMMAGGMQQQMAGGLGAAGMGAGGNVFGKVIEEMMKQAGGQAQPQAPQSSGNPWGDVLDQILKGATGNQAPPQREAPTSSGNPWGDIMDQILKGATGGGQAAPQPRQREAQPSANDNPFGRMLEEMMRGGGQASPRQAEPEPEEQPRARAQAKNPYDDMFGDMFETGRKTQETYQKGLESIFEQFHRGMDKNR
jgi:hypothetical protein